MTNIDPSKIIPLIKGLSADSREIHPGYLFAALPGTRFNGCDFIDQAIINGASHILVPRGAMVSKPSVNVIESDQPHRDFALLCAAFYQGQPDHIVAVTGTNGKTSVADFVRQIFEIAGVKSASLGTLGLVSKHVKGYNVMTTPDPVRLHGLLADLKAAGVDHLAMEASSHGLDQYRLDGVKPQVAAFTNLTQDHLDYHETMDKYFAAKSRLFTDVLADDGKVVANIDDEWAHKLPRVDLSYGQSLHADMRLVKQIPTHDGQDIQIQYKGDVYNIHLPLIGLFQAYNVMCAACCCIALGMDKDAVIESLPKLHGVAGRMQLAGKTQDDKAAYIDYAHTPDALEKALTAMRPHVKGKLIVVFGAGGNRDKGKRPKMGRVADALADHIIVTDDNPRYEDAKTIRDEILTACPRAETIGDRAQAIAHAVRMMQSGDVVLVAGKGHEKGQIIGDDVTPFDDLDVTKQAMAS